MNLEKIPKQEIASNLLETALALFFAQRELFSVITLAGAAEEIFGHLLEQKSGKGGSPLRSVLGLLRPGKAKGERGVKSTSHETELHVHMDVRQEALFLLGRAIDDYQELTGLLSGNMQRFNKEFRGSKG